MARRVLHDYLKTRYCASLAIVSAPSRAHLPIRSAMQAEQILPLPLNIDPHMLQDVTLITSSTVACHAAVSSSVNAEYALSRSVEVDTPISDRSARR